MEEFNQSQNFERAPGSSGKTVLMWFIIGVAAIILFGSLIYIYSGYLPSISQDHELEPQLEQEIAEEGTLAEIETELANLDLDGLDSELEDIMMELE